MKKFGSLFTALVLVLSVNAQDAERNIDLRFGLGSSLLGTGDMLTLMVENELNVNLNEYFVVAGGLGFGRSHNGVFEQASFVQTNANIYFSPFKNSRVNDFRIGTGLSWYTVADTYQISAVYQDGVLVDADYVFDQRNSFGLNVVIENTYSITDKFMMGIKLFTQPYQNGDINSGGMLKFGVKI